MPSHIRPNDEQQQILEAYSKGPQVIIINALAGTGKTSTLCLLAEATNRDGYYLAFNARLAREARGKLPRHFQASTLHSLAFNSAHPFRPGKTFSEMYGAKHSNSGENRIKSNYALTLAFSRQKPDIVPPEAVSAVAETITRFCHSIDERISSQHVPEFISQFSPNMIEGIISMAQHVFEFYSHCNRLPDEREPSISHDVYLKLYSLSDREIAADVVFLDEAQDANPCIIRILESQIKKGKQIVIVGDAFQHIYGFRMAVDAMGYFARRYPDAKEFPLLRSYRFGCEIAEASNVFLRLCGSPWMLLGVGPKGVAIDDTVEKWSLIRGNAYLYRTNFALLMDIIEGANSVGVDQLRVIGGTEEMVSFLSALADLYRGIRPNHPEIGMFSTWKEIEAFSETMDGSHLLPLVTYVRKEGGSVSGEINLLKQVSSFGGTNWERENCAIMSTAHKAKGMEFDTVNICQDMNSFLRKHKEKREAEEKQAELLPKSEAEIEAEFGEIAIAYVSVTRAKTKLRAMGLLGLARDMLDRGWRFARPTRKLELLLRAAQSAEPGQRGTRKLPAQKRRSPVPPLPPAPESVAPAPATPVTAKPRPAKPRPAPQLNKLKQRVQDLGLGGWLARLAKELKS